MRRTDDHTTRPGRAAPLAGRRGLRLVGDDARTPHRASREDTPSPEANTPAGAERVRADRAAHRRWEVSAENQAAASSFDAGDARWVLAVRAADALEGGRAAVLKPEARTRLLTSAQRMGLRPFDANLVLAVVQDAARQGQTPGDAETIDRLNLVGPSQRYGSSNAGLWVVLSIALSAVWAGALVWWLVG